MERRLKEWGGGIGVRDGEKPRILRGEADHEGLGAPIAAQRECRRHSCYLLRVGAEGLGPALWRVKSFGRIFLGDLEGSL